MSVVDWSCLGLVSYLYEKYVIGVDGRMIRSELPIEFILGWEWDSLTWRDTMCIAYSKRAGDEPHNRYWEAARNPRRMPRLRGTVVVYMPYVHVKPQWVYHGLTKAPRKEQCQLL